MLFVGLDHSLTAFGLVAVHSSWEQDFRRVRRVTLETKPGLQLVQRRAKLADDVCTWIMRRAVEHDLLSMECRIVIEGGIFNARNANSIRSQERLAAVVEHVIWDRLKIEVQLVEQRHARSIFMGKSLSGGRGSGDAAQELLKACIPDYLDWDEAELDAFIVANAALCDAGEAFVSVAPGATSEKGAA